MMQPRTFRKGQLSILAVAKAAGVSQATVSRVINKRPGVSSEATKAVRDAMSALGYQPPPLDRRPGPRPARRLPEPAGQPGKTIAVLLVDELYRYSPGLCLRSLRGIEREATEHGWRTTVAFLREADPIPKHLRDEASGLLLMGSRIGPRIQQWLLRCPHVWMTSYHDPSGDTALAGNHEIAQLAFDYLHRRGHQHMAFLAVMSKYPAYPARAQAFKFYASTHGVSASAFMDDSSEGAADPAEWDAMQHRMNELVDRMLATSPRPTGLFIGNDIMVGLCYRALRSRKLIPGKDVDVVSCNNDMTVLAGLDPVPATIDLGSELMGRRSVEQLLRKIRRPDETRQVRIAISPILIEPKAG